jgi:hypothetical protein
MNPAVLSRLEQLEQEWQQRLLFFGVKHSVKH